MFYNISCYVYISSLFDVLLADWHPFVTFAAPKSGRTHYKKRAGANTFRSCILLKKKVNVGVNIRIISDEKMMQAFEYIWF